MSALKRLSNYFCSLNNAVKTISDVTTFCCICIAYTSTITDKPVTEPRDTWHVDMTTWTYLNTAPDDSALAESKSVIDIHRA